MITSPCTGVCAVDPATGWCAGCGRTRDEIGIWGGAAPEARSAIWAALPARLDRLGVLVRRPDWDEAAMRAVVLDSLQRGTGVWRIGPEAARIDAAIRDPAAVIDGDRVIARGATGALRLRINRHVRALQVAATPAATTTVLAVLRLRLPDERPDALTEIGPDTGAIDPDRRSDTLFDLGLGLPMARFMLRTGDAALRRCLEGLVDLPPDRVLTEAGTALADGGATAVVETLGARAEAPFGTGTAVGTGASTGDCRARLDLATLALGQEGPPGIDLPEANVPVAVHMPLRARAAA